MSINNLNFILGPKELLWSGGCLNTACVFYENALKKKCYLKSEVLAAVTMKITFFSDVTPYIWVDKYHSVREVAFFHDF